jgi:hypothetical protein
VIAVVLLRVISNVGHRVGYDFASYAGAACAAWMAAGTPD